MKIEWRKLLSREGVDLTTICGGVDNVFYSLIWEATGTRKELFFTYFKDKGFTHYIAVDPQKVGFYIFRKLFNSIAKIKKYYREGKILLTDIEEKTKNWQSELRPKSESQLFLAAYRDFNLHLQRVSHIYSILSWFAIEAWQNEFEKILVSMIERNKLESQREKIISSVYRPWKNTAIPEIREKIKKWVDLKKLVDDYQFLRSWSVIWYRPIDEFWIKNLGQFSEGAKKGSFYGLEELVELLKPSKEEEHYLRLAPYLTFFKDWRDDLRRKFVYYWSFLFQLIAKRVGVECNDLGYLASDEIKDCIRRGKAPRAVIKRRKINPCIVTADAPHLKMRIIDKKALVAKYIKIMEESAIQERGVLIKGLVAQEGKVQGRVKIIRTYHNIKDMQDGSILVANTTHPNYLPAMQKAAAFVTNEGGIVCHAAIVAREMKKPCIVGTKVATQVLKDGDLVEVDAEKGVVKIIQ